MLCKRAAMVLFINARSLASTYDHLVLLPSNTLLRSQITTSFTKSFSSKKKKIWTTDEQSFTASYLVSSCGLSPETALRASQKVRLQSADRPDSVLALLRNHGFTDAHISKIVTVIPTLLLSDPQDTLLPKLEFFLSIRTPTADLVKILSSNPSLFKHSLKTIICVYNYLKSSILLDDKKVGQSLKASSWIFGLNLEKRLLPRIAGLRRLGVPESSLADLVTHYHSVLLVNANKFDKTVKEVMGMGFNPKKKMFIRVLQMMMRTCKLTWERKVEVYKKCGWSEDDFQLAFKRGPQCMGLSEEKIISAMDFLVNNMGWKPGEIARVPTVLGCSLRKRIVPRCLVIKVLLLKGFVKKAVPLSTLLLTDKNFLDRFVAGYVEDVPQLLDVFNGKVGLAELGFQFEKASGQKLL